MTKLFCLFVVCSLTASLFVIAASIGERLEVKTTYSGSNRAGGYGDPHLVTWDGRLYTFSGIGDFVLVNSSDFIVHARTQAIAGADPKVAIFAGVALKTSTSSIVQVTIDEATRQMSILVDRTTPYTMDAVSAGVDITGGNLYQTDTGDLGIVFVNGAFATVKYYATLGIIAFTMSPPVDASAMASSSGLLGSLDLNRANDFKYPNGTILAQSATDLEIFAYGNKWQVQNEVQSLFTYTTAAPFLSFFNDYFVPIFLDYYKNNVNALFNGNDTLFHDADAICPGDKSGDVYLTCMFDASQMGTAAAAQASREVAEQYNSTRDIANNMAPVITMPNPINVKLNEVVYIPFNIIDPEGNPFSLVVRNLTDAGSVTYNDTYLTFVVTRVAAYAFQLVATDSGNASSYYQPMIVTCDCSQGTCDYTNTETLNMPTQRVTSKLAMCMCMGDWSGDRCDVGPCNSIVCYPNVECNVNVTDQKAICGACPAGMDGDGRMCLDRDECAIAPTICPGKCVNTPGSYYCECTTSGGNVEVTGGSIPANIDDELVKKYFGRTPSELPDNFKETQEVKSEDEKTVTEGMITVEKTKSSDGEPQSIVVWYSSITKPKKPGSG